MTENALYYGDNLDILRHYIPDESVDLIYLDPPFNSSRDYNVLFHQSNGTEPAAQIQAFEDSWTWDQKAEATLQELREKASASLLNLIDAFVPFLGRSPMMAYLVMMAIRLVELHRVLKPTGSIYLHCDPTASHYLKALMDGIFGPRQFRNEIVWKRQSAHSGAKRWGDVHDTLLFYTKTEHYTWNTVYQPYDEKYLSDKYRYKDHRGRYMTDNLTGAGITRGDSGRPWRDFDPTVIGRHWAVPRNLVETLTGPKKAGEITSQEKLDLLDSHNYIYWPSKIKGFPRVKRYIGKGVPIQSNITDISPINSQAAERLGYPTQKPLALLVRIIQASSNEGDLVLDPFCGCGTAVDAAQHLGRRWIGIDITHLAINLIRRRLQDRYGDDVEFEVIGEPRDEGDARVLAEQDRHLFQSWALNLVDARPAQETRGADRGMDGLIFFSDDGENARRAIVQVKSGHVGVRLIRDLVGTVQRENNENERAPIGIFVTLEPPTSKMKAEAVSAGFYQHPLLPNQKVSRIQILTVKQLLEGKKPDLPHSNPRTYAKAGMAPKRKKQETLNL